MLELLPKPSFLNALVRLPQAIQIKITKCLALLGQDPRHPSLHTKKMKGQKDIWEIRVDDRYRILCTLTSHVISLLTVGFVGMSRAMRRLLLVSSLDQPSPFLRSLDEGFLENRREPPGAAGAAS